MEEEPVGRGRAEERGMGREQCEAEAEGLALNWRRHLNLGCLGDSV